MSDHIVDANKMVETPRTNKAESAWLHRYRVNFECGWPTMSDVVDADFARQLERELAAANAEVAHLKSGGCARDQSTTQFCAEAVELSLRLEEANKRIAVLEREADEHAFSLSPEMVQARNDQLAQRVAELEQWIRSLDTIKANPTQHRLWCGEIGWLYPGQCVFVGADKPEGLR